MLGVLFWTALTHSMLYNSQTPGTKYTYLSSLMQDQMYAHKGGFLMLSYIPSHRGIHGNEVEDRLSKEITTLLEVEIKVVPSLSHSTRNVSSNDSKHSSNGIQQTHWSVTVHHMAQHC